jgi:UDP-2-acetamido-3-amino-2,3-dideoxy-glucuronate N-acetyltransferase
MKSLRKSKSFIAHQPTNLWGKNKIGNGTTIGAFADIGNVVIGSNCKIQCHVSIPPGTVIGDNVFIGPGAKIANDRLMDNNMKGTVIKNGVRIGMGALIGAGLTIGENSIIGMGAVVIHDIFDGEVWAGNPARLIK